MVYKSKIKSRNQKKTPSGCNHLKKDILACIIRDGFIWNEIRVLQQMNEVVIMERKKLFNL